MHVPFFAQNANSPVEHLQTLQSDMFAQPVVSLILAPRLSRQPCGSSYFTSLQTCYSSGHLGNPLEALIFVPIIFYLLLVFWMTFAPLTDEQQLIVLHPCYEGHPLASLNHSLLFLRCFSLLPSIFCNGVQVGGYLEELVSWKCEVCNLLLKISL